MRVLLRNWASPLIAASLIVVGTASRADELLVMPYSCSVVGGQPVLTRSHDEGHRILGQREQRHFTACSPVNPGMCRHWTLHRFDLDCGGVRVPWVSVVAATGGTRNGRAWVEDGRLRVRVGPWWNMAPGDPCARVSGYDDRWQSGGLARYCADRKTLAPPATVEMPSGFAPMLGIDAVFVAATVPKSSTPAPTIAIPAPPRVARIETPQPPRSEATPRDATAKEAPAKSRPTPEAESQPTSPPLVPAPTPAATPGSPTKPRIINRLDPAPGDAPQQAPSTTIVPKTPTPSAEASPKSASAPELEEKANVQASRRDKTEPRSEDKAISVSLLSTISSPSTTVVVVAVAGLTVLLIAAFALIRRRETSQLAGAASREFASVSLGAQGGREKPPSMRTIAPVGQLPSSQNSASVPSSWGDSIPRTREEALQVLGIGVTPDASEAAIKKIVDGLRLSWHPDYAEGPADQQIRELRLKQINAAWEIIAGKRAQA
jgi:hypothetical protein